VEQYLISIRKATYDDKLILFNWANKFDSLSVKIENKNKILLFEHEKWLSERLRDTGTYIWIILKEKIPVGQIRFQKKIDKYFDIDIYLLANERRRGTAKRALHLAHKESALVALRALVKKNNINSYNFFLRNSFYLESEDEFKWVLKKNN